MPKHTRNHWPGRRDRGNSSGRPKPTDNTTTQQHPNDNNAASCVTYEECLSESMPKAPKHLKGKEIGLWYARRSREKKDRIEADKVKSMGIINIPSVRAKQILEFLSNLAPIEQLPYKDNYEDVPNSKFKRDFLDLINTNIKEKLMNLKSLQRDTALDERLQGMYEVQRRLAKYRAMQSVRQQLPAYRMREQIIELINTQQVVIISGETGCGKTTQIPQFILDDHLANGRGSACRIVCSQPRRISAISIAERVAEERAEILGESVGYQIRLEHRLPRERGSILFCTTGIILKQMESNIGLSGVSHLVLDEIHERDVLSDFILALLKQILSQRSNLKVVLMSATLNAEKFAAYFDTPNIIAIPGFTHEVKEYYLEDALLRTRFVFPVNPRRRGPDRRDAEQLKASAEFKDFILPHVRRMQDMRLYPPEVCRELLKEESEELTLDLVLRLVEDICKKEEDKGAILVFLTGYAHIANLHTLMQSSGAFPSSRFLIIPLHSQMPTAHQKVIFKPPRNGVRKIILATNIAETSITIDDVVFVVDCGRIKISDFNSGNNEDSLRPIWVSKANADQRRGRAGRVRPGVCYHLFSRARNMLLEAFLKPELLRKRLDGVILNLKLLQLGAAEEFLTTCLDPPDADSVRASVDFLKRLNALDDNEVLTPLGYHLARLPVAPQMGKMMLLGALFGCVNPIVNIASTLDFKDPFLMPLGQEDQCRRSKQQLAEGHMSDHLLFHTTMTRYERVYDKDAFCWEFYLSRQTMAQLAKMKSQFAETLHELNFLAAANAKLPAGNVNSDSISLIKAIVCASLYPNVFLTTSHISKKKKYTNFRTMDNKKLDIHPKSVVMRAERFESPFLVYYRKVRSTSDFVHDASIVHTLPLLFFGDRFKRILEDETLYISINDRLKFKTNEETYHIIDELRNRLNCFLVTKACQPAPVDWENEEEVGVLKAIIGLITIEHEGYKPEDF